MLKVRQERDQHLLLPCHFMIEPMNKEPVLFIDDEVLGSVIVNSIFHSGVMVLEVRDVQTC